MMAEPAKGARLEKQRRSARMWFMGQWLRYGIHPRAWVDRHFGEDVLTYTAGRHAPRMLRIGPLLTCVGLLGGAFFWFIFITLARLKGAHIQYWHAEWGDLKEDDLFDLARATATLVALFGGLFAVVYAYRKQRVEEAAGRRADEENLREIDAARSQRYQDAAEQLGHEKAAVRLAGVYALARLADEWPTQQQTCVDVLCAYLRMPYDEQDLGDGQVRRSVVGVIREHLLPEEDELPAWAGLRFDLEGATFVDADFSDCYFAGAGVSFKASRFLGTTSFDMTQLSTTNFNEAVFAGSQAHFNLFISPNTYAYFVNTTFEAGKVVFNNVQLHSSRLIFDGAHFSGSDVTVRIRESDNQSYVEFSNCTASAGQLDVGAVAGDLLPPLAQQLPVAIGSIRFRNMAFAGGKVRLPKAQLDQGLINWSPGSPPKHALTHTLSMTMPRRDQQPMESDPM
ncbi:pentapeptide repeat-containing protein [Motilibacter aurantiacus]|uniref:pentapeptide repeat-containing protein n=1 Tax=Motilibacter aurantiacus TaxID=2714955 RepID=UPI00140AAEF0|nr:pentapeptide repeat-containing protein [Motilibacter aurantiacus]NHC47130.1 pentapeptide repeat-containing protein [Motilibacter aurantiacus]